MPFFSPNRKWAASWNCFMVHFGPLLYFIYGPLYFFMEIVAKFNAMEVENILYISLHGKKKQWVAYFFYDKIASLKCFFTFLTYYQSFSGLNVALNCTLEPETHLFYQNSFVSFFCQMQSCPRAIDSTSNNCNVHHDLRKNKTADKKNWTLFSCWSLQH